MLLLLITFLVSLPCTAVSAVGGGGERPLPSEMFETTRGEVHYFASLQEVVKTLPDATKWSEPLLLADKRGNIKTVSGFVAHVGTSWQEFVVFTHKKNWIAQPVKGQQPNSTWLIRGRATKLSGFRQSARNAKESASLRKNDVLEGFAALGTRRALATGARKAYDTSKEDMRKAAQKIKRTGPKGAYNTSQGIQPASLPTYDEAVAETGPDEGLPTFEEAKALPEITPPPNRTRSFSDAHPPTFEEAKARPEITPPPTHKSSFSDAHPPSYESLPPYAQGMTK